MLASEGLRRERRLRGDQSLDQGEFGEAWVQVLAAAAGLDCSSTAVQRGSADFIITYPHRFGFLNEFDIKAQVKTVADPVYDGHGNIVYDLDADAHRHLAGPSQTPMFLFLVVVSGAQRRWVRTRGSSDDLGYGAFWHSFAKEQPTTNSATKRVSVPIANRLSPTSLRGLCVGEALRFLIAADRQSAQAAVTP